MSGNNENRVDKKSNNNDEELLNSPDSPRDDQNMEDWDGELWALLKRMEAPSSLARPRSDKETKRINSEIERAFLSLPIGYREVLDLYQNKELSLAEIADILGTDIAGVKWRIHRARVLFRALLPAYFKTAQQNDYTGWDDERQPLPNDEELSALIKNCQSPQLANNFENRLLGAYRAQMAQPGATVKIAPLARKNSYTTILVKRRAPILALAAGIIICFFAFILWTLNQPRNSSNNINVVGATQSPKPHNDANGGNDKEQSADNEGGQNPPSNDVGTSPDIKKPRIKGSNPEQIARNNPSIELITPPDTERGKNGNRDLRSLKHLYVDSLGDDDFSKQLRKALIEKLTTSGRWEIADDWAIEQADAVFERSPKDNNKILLVSGSKIIWQKSIFKIGITRPQEAAADIVNALEKDSQ